jgi:hypothetical protein
VAAWAAGLLVVVGAALAGSGSVDGETVAVPSPAVGAVASGALPVNGTGRSMDGQSSGIILDAPATTDQLITSHALVVRGHVQLGTGRIQIVLQSGSAAPIVVATVQPTILPDRRGRVLQPQFVVALALPDPRPSGPAVVQVVAYDARGRASDVLLRPIRIGAVLDATYGDGAWDPPTGEDGLMGGITSGTSFSWLADGR